jgi:hypothetical protein
MFVRVVDSVVLLDAGSRFAEAAMEVCAVSAGTALQQSRSNVERIKGPTSVIAGQGRGPGVCNELTLLYQRTGVIGPLVTSS